MDGYYVMLTYLYLVNLGLFVMMGLDKRAARRHRRRIAERVLLGLALLGGSIGGIGGMLAFRHKTRKPAFYIGMPVMLVAELLFFLGIIWAAGL